MEQKTTTNSAMLIWQEGAVMKQAWILEQEEILLGRDETCEIKLSSRWISRKHARLCLEGNRYVIDDLGSKNGVYVNGDRIYGKQVLSDGDKIQLAPELDLIFVDQEATAPVPGRGVERLHLDQDTRQVYIKGQLILPPLSNHQFQLLSLLAEAPGKVYSRSEIIETVWWDDLADGVSDDAVDAMLRRLRQRLAQVDPQHAYIITVRGYGFKLNLEG